MRLSDLDTDEEDQVANKMRKYEKKIGGLMSQVGSLKSEVRPAWIKFFKTDI